MAYNSQSMVELVKVSKTYPPDIMALQDVSLSVQQGEMVFLTGMSGAGKTTLLKLICSLETSDKGHVEVAGHDLNRIKPVVLQRLRQKIGVAYQDFRLLPMQTVYQNIAMAMEVAYLSPAFIRKRVEALLEQLGIADKRDKLAGKISRGEQQRVAIARAAANAPTLLLADEPTGNLDHTITKLVVNLLESLNQTGTTLLIATHDQSIYSHTNHRVINLAHGRLTEPVMEP